MIEAAVDVVFRELLAVLTGSSCGVGGGGGGGGGGGEFKYFCNSDKRLGLGIDRHLKEQS